MSTSLNWNFRNHDWSWLITRNHHVNWYISHDLWWSKFMIFGDLAWRPSKWSHQKCFIQHDYLSWHLVTLVTFGDLWWLLVILRDKIWRFIMIYHNWPWQITIQLTNIFWKAWSSSTSFNTEYWDFFSASLYNQLLIQIGRVEVASYEVGHSIKRDFPYPVAQVIIQCQFIWFLFLTVFVIFARPSC